jgi:hypothetical protein
MQTDYWLYIPSHNPITRVSSLSTSQGGLLTSHRGLSSTLKKCSRLPGHIFIGPSTVPPLNHDLQGEFHAVRLRKSSLCLLKSLTASCFGTKDLMPSVWSFVITFSMCRVMSSIAGRIEPWPNGPYGPFITTVIISNTYIWTS